MTKNKEIKKENKSPKKARVETAKNKKPKLTFYNMMWLFVVFSLVGVVGEGLWTVVFSGHWETHVVSMWTPLCIIYGLGAVGYYIADYFMKKQNIIVKFLVVMFVASLVEYLCGIVLEFGMNMRAWSYKNQFLNIGGHICLSMSLLWGALGIMFSYLLVPPIDKILLLIQGKIYNIISLIVTIILILDFTLTFFCMVRWHKRHYSVPPKTEFGKFIDETYDDDFMQNRFIEWSFID